MWGWFLKIKTLGWGKKCHVSQKVPFRFVKNKKNYKHHHWRKINFWMRLQQPLRKIVWFNLLSIYFILIITQNCGFSNRNWYAFMRKCEILARSPMTSEQEFICFSRIAQNDANSFWDFSLFMCSLKVLRTFLVSSNQRRRGKWDQHPLGSWCMKRQVIPPSCHLNQCRFGIHHTCLRWTWRAQLHLSWIQEYVQSCLSFQGVQILHQDKSWHRLRSLFWLS